VHSDDTVLVQDRRIPQVGFVGLLLGFSVGPQSVGFLNGQLPFQKSPLSKSQDRKDVLGCPADVANNIDSHGLCTIKKLNNMSVRNAWRDAVTVPLEQRTWMSQGTCGNEKEQTRTALQLLLHLSFVYCCSAECAKTSFTKVSGKGW